MPHLGELYVAFFNRVPDADGLAYWIGELAEGKATHGSLVSSILDAAHTFAVDWGLGYGSPEEAISKGMAIAAAVTPTGTEAALELVGISPADMHLG